MLPFNAKSFLLDGSQWHNNRKLKKISSVGNCSFLFTGKISPESEIKNFEKILRRNGVWRDFNCPKDEKLKIENCHVSIFGFRKMMIKDLHVTSSKSS